jgi:hypothetical protein
MHLYKVDFEFYRYEICSPHCIRRQFLYRGFSGWRVENWVSDVPWSTNSINYSAIYKMGGIVAGYRNLPEINNVCYIIE